MAKKNEDSLVVFSQVLSDLKKKQYKAIYFLCGEETFYIDKLCDYIEEHVLDEAERSFNQSILYGKDVNAATIISEAKRFPMLAEKVVVVVKEAQQLKDLEALESYFYQPNPSTILVIAHKYKSPDGRKKFVKYLQEKHVYFDSKKIYDNKVADWVHVYLKEKKFNIHPAAAQLVADSLGNDLSKVANELNKLIINVPAGTEIQTKHIQDNIGISKDYNMFEFQNAVGQKNIFKINQIINYYAANPKEHPFLLLPPFLFGFFSKLMIGHKTPDKTQLASALGVNPFFVKDYQMAMNNYPPGKLVEIISILREFDLKSKGVESAGATDLEMMKEMMYRILH